MPRASPESESFRPTSGSRARDPEWLREQQYRNAENLNARIALHARFSTNLQQWPVWVMKQLLRITPARADVFEVGAGPGALWTSNLGRVPRGWRIWLTDFSPGMVRAAQHALARDRRFHFTVADAVSLPAADHSQDVVLAHHMLYHVPDRAGAWREFVRILRPGGWVSVALNGRAHMRELVNLARELPGVRVADEGATLGFDLEDAGPEVAMWFEDVVTHPYDDALHVTEAAPLAAYYASALRFVVDDRPALEQALTERIRQDGGIRIGKSSGLVFGRKGKAAAVG